MNSSAADRLLARLNQGDADAAGQVLTAFEPYLRMVIRKKISQELQAKFDSDDIVQSVWADVVEGLRRSQWKFESVHQLRAFLVTMARNRFVDRFRKHRRALQHELPLPPQNIEKLAAAGSPRPSETFAADELWNQMLEACPPGRREVLLLKRQGASLDEIAAQTGLHKGSVRRILYQVDHHLARLAARNAR
jgi:RNA polymerase sigma-70 factor (ECF subfamily)